MVQCIVLHTSVVIQRWSKMRTLNVIAIASWARLESAKRSFVIEYIEDVEILIGQWNQRITYGTLIWRARTAIAMKFNVTHLELWLCNLLKTNWMLHLKDTTYPFQAHIGYTWLKLSSMNVQYSCSEPRIFWQYSTTCQGRYAHGTRAHQIYIYLQCKSRCSRHFCVRDSIHVSHLTYHTPTAKSLSEMNTQKIKLNNHMSF